MRIFRVLRENRDKNIAFNYRVAAGTVLQPPMPLPLLEKPTVRLQTGEPPRSLNHEASFWMVSSNTASGADGGMQATTQTQPAFQAYRTLVVQDLTNAPVWLYATNVDASSYAIGGVISLSPPYALTPWTAAWTTNARRWRFGASDLAGLAPGNRLMLAHPNARTNWTVTITETNTADGNLYAEVEFATDTPEPAKSASLMVLPATGITGNQYANWRLAPELIPDAPLWDRLVSFTLQDRKGNVWVYRGPHQETNDTFMVMQFYYKTLPGFFFPGLGYDHQPPPGTITPYLRPLDAAGDPLGDGGAVDEASAAGGGGPALGIAYRPYWPPGTPVLQMAETLTLPKRGLPSVRGQSSLEVVYQQSQWAGGVSNKAVVLHDPTREKSFELGPQDGPTILGRIPSSIKTQSSRGKTFFPNLPPHLANRFFLDPNRGANGALVFKGQFVDEPVGEKYLLLNVLGQQDVAYLKGLCLADDPDKTKWDAAVSAGLTTTLELFRENPARPGTYIPSSPVQVGPPALCEVHSANVAVDSYALTAVGPGVGFVTLIAGNGRAFTPEEEPVSLHVVKVVDTLFRGEVKVIASSNPLNEKLTLQQVVDLAGAAQDYSFEWKIAAPVDGMPPVVYQNQAVNLLGRGTWSHVRFPVATDRPGAIQTTPAARVAHDVGTSVIALSPIPYLALSTNGGAFQFTLETATLDALANGSPVLLRDAAGRSLSGTVTSRTALGQASVTVGADQGGSATAFAVVALDERIAPGRPQSILFRSFTVPASKLYSALWLSLDLDSAMGARVYIDGQPVAAAQTGTGDSAPSSAPTSLGALSRAYRLGAEVLSGGTGNGAGAVTHWIAVELFSAARPGTAQSFDVRLDAFESVDLTATGWVPLDASRCPDGVRAILGGTADVRSLADNYVIMRYQARNTNHAAWKDNGSGGNRQWSSWTEPQLAEGWIKRVLAGINPFNQRVNDLFNNRVNTDVSILTQAGHRWEGDVVLNLDTINASGLIEIYETVLRRGRMLSIDAGVNYGPANDALLLAAGYLNDLYMMIGNEAWADAANPTIGIGTKDNTYGDIATALFAFKGQVPSLLAEELTLLRGRDDFMQPGVETPPIYNRLFWNYTRGIDAGEVLYALNYNVLDQNNNGTVNADDARVMYPQGHGDAYGHYLTALSEYYSLLLNLDFDWVPKTEAVTVLGKPVQVGYQSERKFAAAAAALARTGQQVFDLTWRQDYRPGTGGGWSHFAATRVNARRATPTTRYWGLDHWGARSGQGAYINWIVGNAILPDVDTDPSHEGIQVIDRSTVPELKELPTLAESLQRSMDNAEAGLTPLGFAENAVPFDINPSAVVGGENQTHFEQVYHKAKATLNNALAAFDDAKDVTRLMRSESDSAADVRATVDQQELAYERSLIELYGTPYPDDCGPGRTYVAGFSGPDLLHYMYVDTAELTYNGMLDPSESITAHIDIQGLPTYWLNASGISYFNFITKAKPGANDALDIDPAYASNTNLCVEYTLSSHGFFDKPATWRGRRASPGRIQQAISDIIKARNDAAVALGNAEGAKADLDWAIRAAQFKRDSHGILYGIRLAQHAIDKAVGSAKLAWELAEKATELAKDTIDGVGKTGEEALPKDVIVGLANGGDLSAPARAALKAAGFTVTSGIEAGQMLAFTIVRVSEFLAELAKGALEDIGVETETWLQEEREVTSELRSAVGEVQGHFAIINRKLQELDDAQRRYRSLVAEGERIMQEREIFRQRAAAVIQGYRTRDAAFRIFRNEKLERYKSLFDLASRYSFLAAQAFDYETGLLHKQQGKEFLSRIVSSRALGVMKKGEPQYAGSDTGDPGLSSAMAEMYADWLVLKGRLGFNNPDGYGTTVSLRTENFRILPGVDGDTNWKDLLNRNKKANLLDDPEVRQNCMQIDAGNGLTVPGIVVDFSTTIADGVNLFGLPLAAGDHAFSPSSFATKLFAVGVALEGYQGMDNPSANSTAVGFAGGSSPAEPSRAFLDPKALAATPYIYLIPVGVDSMRSPPLGDASVVRTWSVADVSIPLPFNIGGSDLSTKQLWQSSDSLTEPLFAIRKHQAFRPVSTTAAFSSQIYSSNGQLASSQYTNRRLIGRSAWNSRWKLVIPGRTLLNDPNEGLDRFLQSVKDIKLHLVTYSYAGN
jgi:hypothetical protein